MARYKSRAFILYAVDYRETSRLVHLFCENEGRISVIGKGMRSPKAKKAQAADTFNLVQVGYTLKDGSTLGLLSSIDAEQTYPGLRSHLFAYALASFWFEVLRVTGQARVAAQDLFSLTESFMNNSQRAARMSPPEATTLLRLLEVSGFGLNLTHCVECNRQDDLTRLSLASGAAVCSRCTPPRGRVLPYSPGVRRVVESLSLDIPQAYVPADAISFLDLVHEYLALHLDHKFRTYSFLRSIAATSAPGTRT